MRRRFQFSLKSLVVVTILVAAEEFTASPSAVNAGEIETLFFKQSKQKVAAERAMKRRARRSTRPPKKQEPQKEMPIASTGHGITEFGMERTFGFHTAPVYTFIVKSDGTFRFEGQNKVDHMGKWTGRIDREAFNDVARFIRESDSMGLQDRYEPAGTDACAIYTMVAQDGKRHVIQDCFTGPEKLREIERRIYGLLDDATWDEQEPVQPEEKSDTAHGRPALEGPPVRSQFPDDIERGEQGDLIERRRRAILNR